MSGKRRALGVSRNNSIVSGSFIKVFLVCTLMKFIKIRFYFNPAAITCELKKLIISSSLKIYFQSRKTLIAMKRFCKLTMGHPHYISIYVFVSVLFFCYKMLNEENRVLTLLLSHLLILKIIFNLCLIQFIFSS